MGLLTNYHKFANGKLNHKLERIYTATNALAWDDEREFAALKDKYGIPELSDKQRHALANVLGVILVGEYIALETSAALVGIVPDLDAKLALAGQAFDEARHVMAFRRYFKEVLKLDPPKLSIGFRLVLNDIDQIKNPAQKIVGMNYLIELVAAQLFRGLQQAENTDPLLKDYLHLIERDENRHVGIAKAYIPELLKGMSTLDTIGLMGKQVFWFSALFIGINSIFTDLYRAGLDMNKLMHDSLRKHEEIIDEMTASRKGMLQAKWFGPLGDFATDMFIPKRK